MVSRVRLAGSRIGGAGAGFSVSISPSLDLDRRAPSPLDSNAVAQSRIGYGPCSLAARFARDTPPGPATLQLAWLARRHHWSAARGGWVAQGVQPAW
jgi:hypothetical protein